MAIQAYVPDKPKCRNGKHLSLSCYRFPTFFHLVKLLHNRLHDPGQSRPHHIRPARLVTSGSYSKARISRINRCNPSKQTCMDVCARVCARAHGGSGCSAAMWQLTQWKQIATVALQLSITSQQNKGARRPEGSALRLPAATRLGARPLLLANWSFPRGQTSHLQCLHRQRPPFKHPCIVFNRMSLLAESLSPSLSTFKDRETMGGGLLIGKVPVSSVLHSSCQMLISLKVTASHKEKRALAKLSLGFPRGLIANREILSVPFDWLLMASLFHGDSQYDTGTLREKQKTGEFNIQHNTMKEFAGWD